MSESRTNQGNQGKKGNFFNPLNPLLRLSPLAARLLVLAIAAIGTLAVLSLFRSSLVTLEERVGALGWLLAPDTAIEQRITLVTIDERSLAEVGPWPWSRETMAELTEAIANAGAQLQIHDVVYSEPRQGDQALLAALQSSPGAVLAQVPVLASDGTVQAGQMTHPLIGASCNSASSATPNLTLPQTNSYLAPHALFANTPKGHITPLIDNDGAIRKAPAIICVSGEAYPILPISALLQATQSGDWSVTLSPGESLFDPAQILRLDSYPGLEVPLDAEGNLRISYRSTPDSYRAISAVDLLNGTADSAMLDNTWVLLGATAFGMGDIVPTPYSGATPGVELQARMLASMLDTTIPFTPVGAPLMLALLGLAFAAGLLGLATASDRTVAYGLPVAAITLPLAALGVHVQLLATSGIWLGWIAPALFSLLAAGLLLLLEQRRVRAERTRVYGNLSSYLPSSFARDIAFSLPSSAISARRCEVTLLSADLRNFSAFGESRPAEESAAMLHYFFVRATAIIERHGGRIQEFIGDSLLAVWDAQGPAAAQQAYLAAQEMQSALPDELLAKKVPFGLEPLALGIGIEQGPALIGSIGPAQRRTHALLGDTVAITLRIQEMTADLAQPVLLGECVARQLTDQPLESQGSYLLKGLRTPHTLFAPRPAVSERSASAVAGRNGQPALQVLSGGRK